MVISAAAHLRQVWTEG